MKVQNGPTDSADFSVMYFLASNSMSLHAAISRKFCELCSLRKASLLRGLHCECTQQRNPQRKSSELYFKALCIILDLIFVEHKIMQPNLMIFKYIYIFYFTQWKTLSSFTQSATYYHTTVNIEILKNKLITHEQETEI